MKKDLELRIYAMLWDLPVEVRERKAAALCASPMETLAGDKGLFARTMESLTWYELIDLLGTKNLHYLLDDANLSLIFPPQRRAYYKNARRLLSKYAVSVSGQNS